MQILFIEDHADFAKGLTAGMLRYRPEYRFTHCATLRLAKEHLASATFDVALIDLGLPDASGTIAAEAVRDLAPELPIVALTGQDFEELGAQLLRLGLQDFLQKGDVSLARIDQCLQMACARQRREEALKKQAAYDSLTGLANRKELEIQLGRALSNASRSQLIVAVLAIDLDGFKSVNDTYGHAAGDELLKEAAKRLQRWVRAGDCVARTGGDEFVIVLEGIRTIDDALLVANKIRTHLSAPFSCQGNVCRVAASIGIAYAPEHGTDAAMLSEKADAAMYATKRKGNPAVALYESADANCVGDQGLSQAD